MAQEGVCTVSGDGLHAHAALQGALLVGLRVPCEVPVTVARVDAAWMRAREAPADEDWSGGGRGWLRWEGCNTRRGTPRGRFRPAYVSRLASSRSKCVRM